MKETVRAREALKRRGRLWLETSRGLQRVEDIRIWGKNIAVTLDDGRFVVIDPRREILTTKGLGRAS